MYRKIIKNDIMKSKLITITIAAFILLAATLTSLAAILLINLSTSIDSMMRSAKTAHFLQMHSGDIDMERLSSFVEEQECVEDFQVLPFLNIDGTDIFISGNALAGSVQENGFSAQSGRFDFLLDFDDNIIRPIEGEIYIPVYYMKELQANVGDCLAIHNITFKIAGYLRDSQMNAAIVSSKRFLIHENDYEKIKTFGKLEHLIEFRLTDTSAVPAFETAYIAAGLPANGPPAITDSMFKLANAIADGLMIAVLILVSILVIIINFLCIRFTLLAKVEEDYREIGVLKAIGLRVDSIKKLYLAKYGCLAGIACAAGFILSLFVKESFMRNIRLYMGGSGDTGFGTIFGIIGAGCIFLIVCLYVNGVLARFKKISAAEAIRFGAPREQSNAVRRFRLSGNRLFSPSISPEIPLQISTLFSPNVFLGIKDVLSRKKLYSTMLFVLVISSFLMIVPRNIYNTISKRSFMTYMGIGQCDMRIDISQTDSITEKTTEIAAAMAQDSDIEKYTVLMSYMFDMRMEDESTHKLKVELGDHSLFSIRYSAGREPLSESEIAVSTFVADDLEKNLNETVVLIVDGQEKPLIICGIYSDITNGGKTSKAIFETNQSEVLWAVIPADLKTGMPIDKKIATYKEKFSYAKVSDIDEYIRQIFGGITAAVKNVSEVSIIAAAVLTALITALFMKMLVTKDRYSIAVLKSLGFKKEDIRMQYVVRAVVVLTAGVLIGTVLANTLGELAGIGLISSFGASSFHFEINMQFAYLFSPLLMAVCVYLATRFGISDIVYLKISDHIKE